ncbi:MAG: efflux RND transporter periplasmic adaptor subunit [Gammaproteobacteria bacterium]|nr:efflux RND transporter periplasmic adaptor subunit [Gammaproteobacteria bacterium]
MTRTRSSPMALVLLLLLVACGQQNDAADDGDEDNDEETPPVPVEINKPSRGDIYAVYTGTAPIEAYAEADVIAKVAGEVRAILVEEGDDVKKGQVLAQLDGDRLRLELNETSARLNKLKRDYERNVDLSKNNLISEGDFEKIKYEMEALEATHNLASLELDYTQIRAPIDGVISERYIKLGNTLSVNDPVFRVTGFDPLVAYLHIPEREFSNITAGQTVGIDIDALPGPPIQATVTRVSPIVDPATGTFKIAIEIFDESRSIKPGMFARIGVVYDVHQNALQVPRSALVEDLGQSSVFVVEDGKAIRKDVDTGYGDRGMIEIISGIGDDENIIIVGQLGLKSDAEVDVINAPEAEATSFADSSDSTEDENDASPD